MIPDKYPVILMYLQNGFKVNEYNIYHGSRQILQFWFTPVTLP